MHLAKVTKLKGFSRYPKSNWAIQSDEVKNQWSYGAQLELFEKSCRFKLTFLVVAQSLTVEQSLRLTPRRGLNDAPFNSYSYSVVSAVF